MNFRKCNQGAPAKKGGGEVFQMAGVACTSGMQAATRLFSSLYPLFMLIGIRYLVHAIFMMVWAVTTNGFGGLKTKLIGINMMRGIFMFATTTCVFARTIYMPVSLGNAFSLALAPLFAWGIGSWFYGESPSGKRWLLAGTGLTALSMAYLVWPSEGGAAIDAIGLMFACAGTGFNAFLNQENRSVGKTSENSATALFYQVVPGSLVLVSAGSFYLAHSTAAAIYAGASVFAALIVFTLVSYFGWAKVSDSIVKTVLALTFTGMACYGFAGLAAQFLGAADHFADPGLLVGSVELLVLPSMKHLLLMMLFIGGIGMLSSLLLLLASGRGLPANLALYTSVQVPVGMALDWFVLGEAFTVKKLVAIAGLMLSVVFGVMAKRAGKKARVRNS